MAVTLTKEFWTNFVLFVVACVALGLSICAFATPCKKEGFGDQPSYPQQDCSNLKWCDEDGYKDPFCLGDCIMGCPDPPSPYRSGGMMKTGQKCDKLECWPNFTGQTDVCKTHCYRTAAGPIYCRPDTK